MQFAIVNHSTDTSITSAILSQIASAIERQLFEHYAPFWESSGAHVAFYSDLKTVPKNAVVIAIFDNSDQPGALGYHDVTPDGRPYARIFWIPIKNSGGSLFQDSNSLSVTISHEILEVIGDPYASFWAAQYSTNMLYALELCDAVESESYFIDGIAVSNFVGPRFFDENGAGPYDWLGQQEGGHVTKPFQTLLGGYQIVAVNLTNITQTWGENYPEWKKETKSHQAARTAKRIARSGKQ